MAAHGSRRFVEQPAKDSAADDRHLADPRRVETQRDVAQRINVDALREEWPRLFGLFGRRQLNIGGNRDFPHCFPNLDQLGRARCGVGFQLAPLGPGIGLVVVIDVAQEQRLA